MANEAKLQSFGHLGLVVKDADATAKRWESLLGIGPWRIRDLGGPLRMAEVTLGSVLIHLYAPKPDADKNLWADFLKTHGEGLHHICAVVDDVVAATKQLEAEGNKVIFLAEQLPESYVELSEPGHIIVELQTPRPTKASLSELENLQNTSG